MKRFLAPFFLVLLVSTGAWAEPEVVEIRLGQTPPPPPSVDPAKVRAVTRFLSARQAGSIDAARKGEARRLVAAGAKVDDQALLGRPGTRLIAFDFEDAGIEPTGVGRFRVTAYLLFADKDGTIVESRDETLVFAAQGGEPRCASLKATNVMSWDSADVTETAASLGAKQALDRAESFLRAWAENQRRASGFSVADIQKTEKGTLLVQCRRFSAEIGRRGYDVIDSPLVLTQSGDGYRVESN